jgi:hypothetical protein
MTHYQYSTTSCDCFEHLINAIDQVGHLIDSWLLIFAVHTQVANHLRLRYDATEVRQLLNLS